MRVQNIIVWDRIALNQKLGPVFIQNIGQDQGYEVSTVCYIDQVSRPHKMQYLAHHRNRVFQLNNASYHMVRLTRLSPKAQHPDTALF